MELQHISNLGIKKAMAKSMTEALKIPHFGYNDEIDMSELVKLRKQLKGSAILGGVPFSYMPVIIKVRFICRIIKVRFICRSD